MSHKFWDHASKIETTSIKTLGSCNVIPCHPTYQVSRQPVHSSQYSHIVCKDSLCICEIIIMGKNLTNVLWFSFASNSVIMRQKCTKTFAKHWRVSYVSCNNISMARTVNKWQVVCQRWREKRKTDNNKNIQNHRTDGTRFEKGLSSQL